MVDGLRKMTPILLARLMAVYIYEYMFFRKCSVGFQYMYTLSYLRYLKAQEKKD